MNDRERLVEILKVPIHPHELADPAEVVADYLIDNGVTIRKHGRWERRRIGQMDVWGCSLCLHREKNISRFQPTTTNFCPNCGAKMMEDNHD